MSRRQQRHRGPAGAGRARARPDQPGETPGGGSTPRRDRRSSRWDDHRQARRAELTAATVTAIRTHGPDVGMSQVAAQARTSKTVVYRHFADKTDLYLAVCERVATVLVAQLQKAMRDAPDPEGTLYAGIDAYLGLIEADPDVYRYVMRAPRLEHATAGRAEDPVSDLTTLVGDHVSEVIASALHRSGHDAEPAPTWGHALVGMVRAAADQWLAARPDVPRETLARELADLAWGGLAAMVARAATSASA